MYSAVLCSDSSLSSIGYTKLVTYSTLPQRTVSEPQQPQSGKLCAEAWLLCSRYGFLLLMRPSARSSYVNAPCFSKVASALRPVTVREYNSLPQALTPFAKALGDLV